jgi:hypothetical protein
MALSKMSIALNKNKEATASYQKKAESLKKKHPEAFL